MNSYLRGLRGGVPIGVGYLAVAFPFGIMASACGLLWWQAVVVSMTVLTSAGQLAGIVVMASPGQYLEMLISQVTINLRYSFMSVSLSQKTSRSFRGALRWLLGFFITDEIFAAAIAEEEITPSFFFGLATIPYFGWAIGTLLGSVIGNVLPEIVMNALCLAIYGMFLAVIAPKARASRPILAVVLVAVGLRCLFAYAPILREVSAGIAVSICAIAAAVLGAILFPTSEKEEQEQREEAAQ